MEEFRTLDAAGQFERLAALGAAALSRYRIDRPVLEPLQNAENATFRVTAGDGRQYALRIGRPAFRPPRSVDAEMCWLAALRRDTDLRVPTPVPTLDGHLTTVTGAPGVPEARVCAVFEWIEGDFRHSSLTEADLRSVGEMTARLQLHGIGFTAPMDRRRERIGLLTLAARRVSASAAEDPWRASIDDVDDETAALQLVRTFAKRHLSTAEAVLRELAAVKRRLGLGPESFGLIHGDLHQENYLFCHQGLGLIDFDDCGYFYHLYDLAVTISEVYFLPHGPQLGAALLDGYAGLRSLPVDHQRALEVFIAFRWLQIAVWKIELRSNPAFRDTWEAAVDQLCRDIGELPSRIGG